MFRILGFAKGQPADLSFASQHLSRLPAAGISYAAPVWHVTAQGNWKLLLRLPESQAWRPVISTDRPRCYDCEHCLASRRLVASGLTALDGTYYCISLLMSFVPL